MAGTTSRRLPDVPLLRPPAARLTHGAVLRRPHVRRHRQLPAGGDAGRPAVPQVDGGGYEVFQEIEVG